MAVINDPNVAANVTYVGAVDTSVNDFPAHVSLRPDPCGALGHYIATVFTGNIAAGAGALSELVQLRYTGTGKVVVYAVAIEHFRSLGTAFAAGNYLFDVIRSINWTVDGTGGATQVPIRLRTSMAVPTSTVRVATTAALGAGTKSLDAQPLRALRGIHSIAVNGHQLGNIAATANVTVGYPGSVLLLPEQNITGISPVILAQNEGLSIRATVAGTGVWEASFTLRFAEVSNY